jgi:hypothetical protein
MNERIKELSKHAFEYTLDRLNSGLEFRYFQPIWSEKFAELIVRECVQTLLDNTPARYTNEVAEEDWDKGYDRAMKDCVHHIQEHFGVEE